MQELITKFEQTYRKPSIAAVRSGDTVRVHQKIREGNKERVQVFEGLVIRTRRMASLTAALTVRRVASGVGVEKSFMLHAPNVVKVDVLRRSKVRRNFLSYMRQRSGKSTRLREVSFDRAAVEAKEEQPTAAEPEARSTEPEKTEKSEPVASNDQATSDREAVSDEDQSSEQKAEESKK